MWVGVYEYEGDGGYQECGGEYCLLVVFDEDCEGDCDEYGGGYFCQYVDEGYSVDVCIQVDGDVFQSFCFVVFCCYVGEFGM